MFLNDINLRQKSTDDDNHTNCVMVIPTYKINTYLVNYKIIWDIVYMRKRQII